MTGTRRWYAVDRIEGDRVVLIGDDDPRPVELPAASLPFPLREAMVLAARSTPTGARNGGVPRGMKRRNAGASTRARRGSSG